MVILKLSINFIIKLHNKMGSSIYTYNIFIPRGTIVLKTDELQFDDAITPLVNEQCVYCDDIVGKGCVPDVPNQCTSTNPEILNTLKKTNKISDNVCDTICVGQGYCTDYFTTTNITSGNVACGMFNGPQTCSLGKYGTATCATQACKQNTDWGINPTTDISKYTVGYANCLYEYDFTGYNSTSPIPLSKWINDICTGISLSMPKGMDSTLSSYLRDTHVIYAVISDILAQNYNYGYYDSNKLENPFLNLYYLSDDIYNQSINNNLQNLAVLLTPSYSNSSVFPTALTQTLLELIALPVPALTNGVYTITFQLSYPQYLDFSNSTNPVGFFESYMNFILRDSGSSLSVNNHTITPSNMSFSSVSFDGLNVINLQNYNLLPSLLHPSQFKPPFDGNFFGTAQVTATVGTWSPMLVVYFSTLIPSITFDCSKVITDTKMIPYICFVNACQNSDQTCKDYMIQYCAMEYQPPSFATVSIVQKYLMFGSSSQCLCYNSLLAPRNLDHPNLAAMCFDSQCDTQILSWFGISQDSDCAQYCETVWDWTHNTNSGEQPQNPSSMNNGKFASVCGTNFTPYTAPKYQTSILVSGITVLVLMGVLIFAVGMHRGIGKVRIGVEMFIISLVLLWITIYYAKKLSGTPRCLETGDGKYEPKCYSITDPNKIIPTQFCDQILDCECISNEDCSTNNSSYCQSTVCQPTIGVRPFKTIGVKSTNSILVVISIVMLLLFPIALYNLYLDYHWPISKTTFMAIVILIALCPMIYTIYDSQRKKSQIVYTTPTISTCTPSCKPNYCGESDGCFGTCVCPSPQTCDSTTGMCSGCTPSCPTCEDDSGSQQCGIDDGCGGYCACPEGQSCIGGCCV